MIEANIYTSKDADNALFDIRREVFTNEQGVEEEIERDMYDQFAYFVVVYLDKKAVGTGRLIFKDEEFLIGRIAVLSTARGNKFGDLIVKMLVDYAFKLGAPSVVVHSQLQVVNFYKKIGFVEFGESYIEAGIEHLSMRLHQRDIQKSCC